MAGGDVRAGGSGIGCGHQGVGLAEFPRWQPEFTASGAINVQLHVQSPQNLGTQTLAARSCPMSPRVSVARFPAIAPQRTITVWPNTYPGRCAGTARLTRFLPKRTCTASARADLHGLTERIPAVQPLNAIELPPARFPSDSHSRRHPPLSGQRQRQRPAALPEIVSHPPAPVVSASTVPPEDPSAFLQLLTQYTQTPGSPSATRRYMLHIFTNNSSLILSLVKNSKYLPCRFHHRQLPKFTIVGFRSNNFR